MGRRFRRVALAFAALLTTVACFATGASPQAVFEENPTSVGEPTPVFPPFSWDEATRDIPAALRYPTVAPSTQPMPATVAAQQRTAGARAKQSSFYAGLASPAEIAAYTEIYGADEKAVSNPESAKKLIADLRAAAAELKERPGLQRYMLVKAYAIAVETKLPVATLSELREEVIPSCNDDSAVCAFLRASTAAIIADRLASNMMLAKMAAEAQLDLALWQCNHGYLDEASGTLATATKYAKVARAVECVERAAQLRAAAESRVRDRAQYLSLVEAVGKSPDDPKTNAAMATHILAFYGDFEAAVPYCEKSQNEQLAAVAAAAALPGVRRTGAVGMAIASMLDTASKEEKPGVARLAENYLSRYVKAAGSSAFREKLMLTRVQSILKEVESSAAVAPRQSLASVRRVVYVCDASGSMLNMFDAVRIEIHKSVENLKPPQSFNVIFFRGAEAIAADKQGLLPATPDNKAKTYAFMDQVSVHGNTNPIPALELAFRQKPDLIYLQTDGDFSGTGNPAVVEFCRKMTADGKTKINTIAFIGREYRDDPQQLSFVKALQDISKNSGGRFKHVGDGDITGNQRGTLFDY